MEIEQSQTVVNQVNTGSTKQFASLNGYALVKCLGAGFHAKVKLGINPETGQQVAIKIFKKAHSDTMNLKTLKHEISMMQKLNHKNLVNLIDVCEEATYTQKNGKFYNCIAIILEYVSGGELFEYVSSTGRFREEVARAYFLQLLEGLNHIHEKGLAHRDLKPENILFSDQFILKIADFGFATLLEGKEGNGLLKTVLGTQSYMAPEIHAKTPYSGVVVDLFATAVILFIIFTGGPPFGKADPKDPYYKLLTVNKHDTFWAAHSRGKPKDFFTPEFKDLMNHMFAHSPTQRLSLSEIISHPWMKKNISSQEQLTAEFSKRKSVVDAELQKARLLKLAEREKTKMKTGADLVYTGVAGFKNVRSESGEDFELVYKNYKNKRVCKTYGGAGQFTDLVTVYDYQTVFDYLLDKADAFSNQLVLDDNQYKLFCSYIHEDIDMDIKEEIKFEIQLLNNEEDDIVCVDFRRVEGSSMEYLNVVQKVRKLIDDLSHPAPITTL